MEAYEISGEFVELLDRAKGEFTFDESFDKELFCKMMKLSYEYFFKNRDKAQAFNMEEVELYGMVYAYSQIPSVTMGKNSSIFEMSTRIASDVAMLILASKDTELDEDTMSIDYQIDGKMVHVKYNFYTGDFCDYIKFDEEYGWDNFL